MFRTIAKIDVDSAFDLLTLAFLACLFGGAILKAVAMQGLPDIIVDTSSSSRGKPSTRTSPSIIAN